MRSRRFRLLFYFMAPPVIGCLIAMFPVLVYESMDILRTDGVTSLISGFFAMLLMAFIFMGIQSVVYSLLMEFVVREKAKRILEYVLISTILGTIAGSTYWNTQMIFVGGIVGAIVGTVSFKMDKA